MTTVASFRKRTPKSSPTTSPAPLTDPTLCALLLFIAGEHADHEFIARAGAVADAGAHAMFP
jgi:hypothetical protein